MIKSCLIKNITAKTIIASVL